MTFDWAIIVIILQLIFLEGILSIDNAAVLGTLVTPLPSDQPVPWPHFLKQFGERLNPILGHQRMAALRVGILGAYIGRGLMLIMASFVINNPWLKLLGALYLIRLAFENLGAGFDEEAGEEAGFQKVNQKTFWATVLTVEIMDLIFSIDNVVAAVSLSDKLWVVMLGVAIGILTMRFAAGLFSYAVEREPVLTTAAYILILNIGIELILEEYFHVEISDLLRFSISAGTILLSLAYAHFPPLRVIRPVLIWFSHGFGIMNELIDWVLYPLKVLVQSLWRAGKKVFVSSQ
jgi:tellurite resistance protein TerC